VTARELETFDQSLIFRNVVVLNWSAWNAMVSLCSELAGTQSRRLTKAITQIPYPPVARTGRPPGHAPFPRNRAAIASARVTVTTSTS
jgi:hypothetical protein